MSESVKDLLRIVDNAAAIVGTYGRTRQLPVRIDRVAKAALVAEHANQELEAFVRYLYMPSPGVGRYLHLTADGSLRPGVWTPWRGKSELTWTQQKVLRRWMMAKSADRIRSPLNYERYHWYVDLVHFPTVESACGWLTRHRIDANEWLLLGEEVA